MGFKFYFLCGFCLLTLLTALGQGIASMMDTDPTKGSIVESSARFVQTCTRVTKNMTVRGAHGQGPKVCNCVSGKMPEYLKLPAQIDFASRLMHAAPQSTGWLDRMGTSANLRSLKREYKFKLSDGQMADALTAWKVSFDRCLAQV